MRELQDVHKDIKEKVIDIRALLSGVEQEWIKKAEMSEHKTESNAETDE